MKFIFKFLFFNHYQHLQIITKHIQIPYNYYNHISQIQ